MTDPRLTTTDNIMQRAAEVRHQHRRGDVPEILHCTRCGVHLIEIDSARGQRCFRCAVMDGDE